MLRTFRDYLDRGLLTDRKALFGTLRKTVSGETAPDDAYAAERGARLMFLYGQPEFQVLYKANAEQARRLVALRSLLKTGELPKPTTVPESDNHEDALRWLQEGH